MFLFSTDIDGTIYDGPESAELFSDFWSGHRNSLLVYNSGRSVADILLLIENTSLPVPRFITGGVGTEIYDCESGDYLSEWQNELSENWDPGIVDQVVEDFSGDIARQPAECQNSFKRSWFWNQRSEQDISSLSTTLIQAEMSAQVVYSSARDLDVIPILANKGNAIVWLAGRLGIDIEKIIVAGDSGNDSSMFQLEGARGIIPANAEAALREVSKKTCTFESSGHCAVGIVEGINHFINTKS